MNSGFLNNEDEEILLQHLHEGSRTAFDTLYQKYWRLVINAGYKRLKDAAKAEDIAQDVFTQLWLKRKDHVIKNISAYLFTAVRNSVFTLMIREKRYTPVNEASLELKADRDGADAELLYKEFMKAYEAMVDTLPNQQKTIFRMRYNQELSTDEIAKQLQLSPKTVRNHLGRAITTLRTSLMFVCSLMIFMSNLIIK